MNAILPDVSRRGFLITVSAAGALFALNQPAQAADGFAPTIWYGIDRDGVITVHIIRAEMGQHVGTAIARIVADELEADWSKVKIDHVDSDPKWGLMVTGGSWSVWQSYPVYSQAGAAGRIALIEAGAKLLNVAPADCLARNGAVVAGKRSVSYGEIVAKGDLSRTFTAEQLAKLPMKPAAERRIIGKPGQARDIPAKTNGQAKYGLDAKVAGMIYARPKLPPTRYGSKVSAIDETAAKAVPGYIRAIALEDASGTVPGWVMVYADSFVAADRACEALKVTWTAGDTAKVSEADLQTRARALIADKTTGSQVVEDPGVDAAFAAAKSKLEQTYTTSTALHFQMEPVNALAFEKDGLFEIHTGNQWQSLVLPWLATALGRKEDTIVLRTYVLGGGFGRRLNGDYAVGAALASKAIDGKPVKMVMTRADDTRFDSPRSPSVQTLRMAFGEAGRVTAMEHHACAGWPTQAMAPFFMPKGGNGQPYDPFAISGANHWYNVGAQRVRAVQNDLANKTMRPGWLRSVGPGWTNWAVESFMDEAAAQAGVDPLAFRLKMLDATGRNAGSAPNAVGGAKRQAAVLKRLADKAGWGKPLPKNTGLGLATTFGQERDMPTWVACAARVSVDPATGAVKVEKLTLVADAGTIVHPDGALAQMEGAALWGMSLALLEGTTFENGEVKDTNLDSYTPLRMADVPDVEVEFIASTEAPVGLGEPATTVVGPAIGNAIFRAVGARVRDLPIRAAAVKAGMKA
ncbi:MAG: molybdopterin-dependent oxidoreductase [Alphaproteobacteria bacterium]|nr:molybdopterin-dependent oxidoreductase [Alphaproteobacteria bacterium]MBU1515682.1 molybdopterin-dependent oxidoreductase [Alphaproteobacteria bacterium]MBU2094941.1 molybdopterin-dependent oxidoreductase [Alphaproteobacteria bacterium]MBU2150973.1 molybdopterin-dependent oxidoreductase [Alphaproteobacteria bacterium]MBU2305950.1 molybdopterin-dependent oxidoreductase [Alphaproteobacteria bacterium]